MVQKFIFFTILTTNSRLVLKDATSCLFHCTTNLNWLIRFVSRNQKIFNPKLSYLGVPKLVAKIKIFMKSHFQTKIINSAVDGFFICFAQLGCGMYTLCYRLAGIIILTMKGLGVNSKVKNFIFTTKVSIQIDKAFLHFWQIMSQFLQFRRTETPFDDGN